jgi:hypothetical protein
METEKSKRGGFALSIVERMGKDKGRDRPSSSYETASDDKAEPEPSDEGDDQMAQESSMGDFMDAVQNGDKAAALDAFKALMENCG